MMNRLFAIVVPAIFTVGSCCLLAQELRNDEQGRERGRPQFAVRTMGPGLAVRQSGPIMYPWQINVIDRAHFNAADLLVQKGEPAEAVEELRQIVQNSPDDEAVPGAHLSIGNILREAMNDPDGAVAEYRKATGPLACYAAEYIAEIYQGKKQPAEGAAVVEELLKNAQGAQSIALVLVTLSKLHEAAGDRTKAIQTLRRGGELIRDDKEALLRFVSEEQIRNTLEQMARMKEAGRDVDAKDLIEDIKNPWRRRMRDWQERRDGR
ncbi:MAG: tetratricopeptide repeat protein [Planctomycetota bacterium]